MSNSVPSNWKLMLLGSVADVRPSNVDKKSNLGDIPVRLCNYTDVYYNNTISGDIDFLRATAKPRELERFSLHKGDVLITKDSETPDDIAIPAFVEEELENVVCGYHLALLRPIKSLISGRYLAFALQVPEVRHHFFLSASGVTRYGLTIDAIKNAVLQVPQLSEQQKIATILSSVDDVIEKTRAQIDKLKDLKTGMMQELLTQGIGHTEFKDSPIGKIPKVWSMIKVQELLVDTKYALRSGPFGSALLKSELVHSGIPLLGIDNVHVEELRSVFKRFVSNEKFQELKKYRVFPNDVMVTIMGTVGRCCVVPEDFGIALSSKHVWTLSLDKEKYFPELLCWQINFSDWVKNQFLNESQGGVMESISSSTLKGLMVPVPPIEEQKKIVDVHKSLSKRIMRKSDQLRTLIDLKKALMQDLLTGKVRVKVDSPETVAA